MNNLTALIIQIKQCVIGSIRIQPDVPMDPIRNARGFVNCFHVISTSLKSMHPGSVRPWNEFWDSIDQCIIELIRFRLSREHYIEDSPKLHSQLPLMLDVPFFDDGFQKTRDKLIDHTAGIFWDTYCATVGGKAHNGDNLPTWDALVDDESKAKIVDAWRAVALRAHSLE